MPLRNLLMSDGVKKNEIDNCITSIRMPTHFRDKVLRVAKEQFLSFSDYTRLALLEKLKRENALTSSPAEVQEVQKETESPKVKEQPTSKYIKWSTAK